MPRNIVFVLPDFEAGGAQKVLLILAGRLDRAAFTPIIVVFQDKGPFRSWLPPDIEVVSLNRTSLRTALPVLPRTLRRLRPHAIISTMAYVNIGLLLIKPYLGGDIRYLLREANTSRRLSPNLLGQVGYRLAYRFLYPRADHILCPAEFLADELHAEFGISRRQLVLLPNPIDEDALRQAANPPRRISGPGRRFVAVGRLTAQKGYDRLLNDFARLPGDSHLTIFGEGELRGALEAQIAALGLTDRVVLAGFEPRPAPWMAGADALLLPSRWEGLPNVVLEALACGIPVIATREAGGVGEIAARAPTNAVTVVNSGPEFSDAMQAVAPRADLLLRRSLLPDLYRLDGATALLSELLVA